MNEMIDSFISVIGTEIPKRKYISNWKLYESETNINVEAGRGYFIKRSNQNVVFKIPKAPYDGDTFAISDITQEEYSSKIIIDNRLNQDQTFVCNGVVNFSTDIIEVLPPTTTWMFSFTFIAAINRWICMKIQTETQRVEAVSLKTAEYGFANFPGVNSVTEFRHGVGDIPKFVSLMPIENPEGKLGEVWYVADTTTVKVYNSGEWTGRFKWKADI